MSSHSSSSVGFFGVSHAARHLAAGLDGLRGLTHMSAVLAGTAERLGLLCLHMAGLGFYIWQPNPESQGGVYQGGNESCQSSQAWNWQKVTCSTFSCLRQSQDQPKFKGGERKFISQLGE